MVNLEVVFADRVISGLVNNIMTGTVQIDNIIGYEICFIMHFNVETTSIFVCSKYTVCNCVLIYCC